MYQIDNSTAAATQPASTGAGTPGFFTDGSPTGGVPATIVPAEWLNAVQQELINIVEAAGLTPTKNLFNQLGLAIQSGQMNYAADTGTANAYAVALTPAPTALVDGMSLWFKAKTANTGASTLNLNGLGAKPIVGAAHVALQGAEIIANGRVEVIWNATISSWVLAEQTGGALQVPAGSQSNQAVNLGQFTGSNTSGTGMGPGYCKLPNGQILQWGIVSVTTSTATSPGYYGSTAVTFPIAFPNSIQAIVAVPQDAVGAVPYGSSWSSQTKTGFTQFMHSATVGQAWNLSWFAVGN
ncbi:hypothetical protein DyAD56_15800 [Dyella sp. AD56]|uniref:gp53-like domain-containing protein n=1 Tax=Dyella sp. AD56 TaxID=1528744 RepID=UPI000C859B31|nr:hypothetical protein [Dyella sp. AD56]PMQ04151.1 hypothetical protein DyAD56_15800 [Dyella sp. AD56]